METQTVARDDGDANSAEDLRDRPSSCDADCSVKTTPPVERGESWLGPAPMAKATATAKAMLRKSQSPAPESPVPAPESPANTLQGFCSPSGSSAPLQGSIVGRPFALWPRTEADEVQQVKQCNRCIDLGLPDSAQMLALKHPWETAAMVETLTKEEVLGLLELATSREATSHARGAKLKAPSLAAFLRQEETEKESERADKRQRCEASHQSETAVAAPAVLLARSWKSTTTAPALSGRTPKTITDAIDRYGWKGPPGFTMHAAGESSSDGGPLLGEWPNEYEARVNFPAGVTQPSRPLSEFQHCGSTCVETAVAASPVWSGGSCGIEVLTRFQKRDNEMLRELERANQSTGRSSESQTMGATIDVNLSESEIEVNLSESESDSAWRIARSAQLTSVCAGIVAARGGSLSGRETAVAAAAQRSRATEDEPPKVSVLFGLDGWKMCFDS